MHHAAASLSAGSVPVHPKYFVLSSCETTIEATLHGVPDVVAAVDGDDHDQTLAFVDPRADLVAAGPDPHAGAILALLGGFGPRPPQRNRTWTLLAAARTRCSDWPRRAGPRRRRWRSEEHTSELQSRQYLVCRLLL